MKKTCLGTAATIAIMLGTLPIEWRLALWAPHPTSPLSSAPLCSSVSANGFAIDKLHKAVA
jgi:hypothetical protein